MAFPSPFFQECGAKPLAAHGLLVEARRTEGLFPADHESAVPRCPFPPPSPFGLFRRIFFLFFWQAPEGGAFRHRLGWRVPFRVLFYLFSVFLLFLLSFLCPPPATDDDLQPSILALFPGPPLFRPHPTLLHRTLLLPIAYPRGWPPFFQIWHRTLSRPGSVFDFRSV